MIEAMIRSSSSAGESLEAFRLIREWLPSWPLQLDSLEWQPELFPGEGLSTIKSVLLALWTISVSEVESIVEQSDQRWVIDAKKDLSHALNKRPSLWWGYRAMLARCYLATEDALSDCV